MGLVFSLGSVDPFLTTIKNGKAQKLSIYSHSETVVFVRNNFLETTHVFNIMISGSWTCLIPLEPFKASLSKANSASGFEQILFVLVKRNCWSANVFEL